jgi:hypothetical protein
VPLIKQICAVKQLNCHIGANSIGARASDMDYGGDWGKVNFPAGFLHSVTKIGILKIHKEGLVETAHRLKCVAALARTAPFTHGTILAESCGQVRQYSLRMPGM